jgi:integrase
MDIADLRLDTLSFHELERIKRESARVLRRKYNYGKRRPRFGNLNRNFSEDELARFYSCLSDPRYRLIFRLQDMLGLRIGEAVRVRAEHVRHDARELEVITEKSGLADRVLMPQQVYDEVVQYMMKYENEIHEGGGYLFYSYRGNRPRTVMPGHISTMHPRRAFREAAMKAGIAEIYGYSEESTGRSPRPLYRLTTHSHRHYAGTRFYRACKDVVLTNRFLRHARSDLAATMAYVDSEREEVYKVHEEAFGRI